MIRIGSHAGIPIETVNFGHVFITQFEVENFGIGTNSFRSNRYTNKESGEMN